MKTIFDRYRRVSSRYKVLSSLLQRTASQDHSYRRKTNEFTTARSQESNISQKISLTMTET